MPRVNVPGVGIVNFPDEMSEDQIAAEVQKIVPLQASHDPNAETPAAPVNVGGRGTGLDLRKSQRRMTAALPTIGAGVGAAVGGLTSPVTGPVGPAVGAGLGGAAGTALQSLAKGSTPDAGEVLESGLTNAGIQAAGPLVSLAGKGLYKGGVALLPKGIKQASPNIAKTGFREGIALTRRGAEKADSAIAGSAANADGMIAAAEQGGAAPIPPMEVLRSLRPVGQKIRNQEDLGIASDMPQLMNRAKAFLGRGPIPLTKAQDLKREAQDLATTAYKARDKGAVINSTDALTNEAQARGLRQGLETRVPGLKDVNTRTQDLIGVRSGAEHASQTGHILSRLGGTGAGAMLMGAGGAPAALVGAGAGAMLTTPGGLTSAGLALKGAGQVLPDSVRAAILMELLSSHDGR